MEVEQDEQEEFRRNEKDEKERKEMENKMKRFRELCEEFEGLNNTAFKIERREKRHCLFKDPLTATGLDDRIGQLEDLIESVEAFNASEKRANDFEKKVVMYERNPFTEPLRPLGMRMHTGPDPHVNKKTDPTSYTKGQFNLLDLNWKTDFVSIIFNAGDLNYTSESQVQEFVKMVVLDCLKGLSNEILFGSLTAKLEASLGRVFPDMMIFKCLSAVGMCEVKKPSSPSIEVFEDKYIMGQVFSYLLLLREYYGMLWCFGILSTYSEWAICWLSDCDAIAAMTSKNAVENASDVQECVGPDDLDFNKVIIESGHLVLSLASSISNNNNNNNNNYNNNNNNNNNNEISLRRSAVIPFDDASLAKVLASAMYKMYSSPRFRVVSTRGKRLLLSKSGSQWKTLPSGLNKLYFTRFVDSTVQRIYLLRDVGEGAEGRCFVACDESGSVCVAKMMYVEEKSGIIRDDAFLDVMKNWERIFDVHCVKFTIAILLMPFFFTVDWKDENNIIKYKEPVKAALSKIANAGLVHNDLKWCHVMLRRSATSEDDI